MRSSAIGVAFLGVFALAALIYAGEGYSLRCKSQKCNTEKMVIFGGGMAFEQLTGYCDHCKKFVNLSWTREGAPRLDPNQPEKKKPDPIARVWDSKSGNFLTLYPCPDCEKPFAEIKSKDDLKHCPKCSTESPEVEIRVAID